MADVKISFPDNVFMVLDVKDGNNLFDLYERFTIHTDASKFVKRNKGNWDGSLKLFRMDRKTLYIGLLEDLLEFCKEKGWSYEFTNGPPEKNTIDKSELEKELTDLKLSFRDYQLDSVHHCINEKRALVLSPTSSGKTLIIGGCLKLLPTPALILCPTTVLIKQMEKDLVSFGFDPEDIQIIMAGKTKDITKPIAISTIDSARVMSAEWLNQFRVLIVDEVHLYEAKKTREMIERANHVEYRLGFTGTLKGTKNNETVLRGLFGAPFETIKTKELIERKFASNFKINCVILDHKNLNPPSKLVYQDEVKYIIGNERRNKFLLNLADSLDGNVLILFFHVDDHGKILYDMASKQFKNKTPHLVYGNTDLTKRENLIAQFETQNNCVGICSEQIFSTGVSINNLNHLIFTTGKKIRTKSLQAIGRILRLHEDKDIAYVWDFTDDLNYKGDVNFSIKHYFERLKIYAEEDFEYEIRRHVFSR